MLKLGSGLQSWGCRRDLRSRFGIDWASMNDNRNGKVAVATQEAPAAIGPYSQAVRVGDTLFASGQVPIDPATGQLVPGGVTEQTTRVLENVKAVLAKAGLDLAHVVKTT